MTLQDLPQEFRNQLSEERVKLHEENYNTPCEIKLYNPEGTRYFKAQKIYNDEGSTWKISYGAVQFAKNNIPLCDKVCYYWVLGVSFAESANGTKIPNSVGTEEEVLEVIKNIGIFNL